MLTDQIYDFDRPTDRRNTHAAKWDRDQGNVLPMWVADMEFETAPAVKEALMSRAAQGIYGYVAIPDSYYEAEVYWWRKQHGYEIDKSWIEFCTGVIPSLSAVVQALTEPGDQVLIQTPVYNYFNTSIVNNGCSIVMNELVYDQGAYTIDFEDFEKQVAQDKVKLFILCNPHNPVGRTWTKEELRRMGELCLKHDVFVVSDEIHRDLTYSHGSYTPYISLGEDFRNKSITCTAPSKVFNLAGLKTANMIITDPMIKKKVNRSTNDNEVAEANAFGIEALTAAYTKGESWVEALKTYLEGNLEFALEFFEEKLPLLKPVKPEATYLLWVDCRALEMDSVALVEKIIQGGNVRVSAGSQFGDAGDGFIRLNMACPRHMLKQGLDGIHNALNK